MNRRDSCVAPLSSILIVVGVETWEIPVPELSEL